MSEKSYRLTVLGLLSNAIGDADAKKAVDALELHMLRHYAKDGAPGIVLEAGQLIFVTLAGGPE